VGAGAGQPFGHGVHVDPLGASEQAQGFDNWETAEQLAALSDVVRDGGHVTAEQVQALLGRMQGGGQLQPDGTPAAGSVMAPEALPRPEPAQPRSFEQLERALPGVVRGLDAAFAQPPTMENHARQKAARDELDAFTAELNTALDRNARATLGVPELEPLDFGALLGRAREAFADPASIGEDGAHALAAQVNQALDRNRDQALHERDEFEAALVQQARQRRQQKPAATAGR
jgi:hypothetical protein